MDFNQIYQQHKKLVFNLALNYTNILEDAEEVTQDVFVKVHQNLNTFKNKADIKTWLYRLTINQSLDFIKSKQRKKRSFLVNLFSVSQTEVYSECSNFNHPGIEMENKEAFKSLMNKIYQLPENQKSVIILLKIEDLTQKQVAEIMQISEGAVESLFQRAKSNLKKTL